MSKLSTSSRSSKNETDLGTLEAVATLPRAHGIDPAAERRLVKKLDLILLPMFTLMCELKGPSCFVLVLTFVQML